MNVEKIHCSAHSPVSQIASYSVYFVKYFLSSCFEQFCLDLMRTCGFATYCVTDGTSNLRMKCWRLLLPIFLFSSFPLFIMVQVFTRPFSPVCDLCSFSKIFTSCWLDTLQTWLELSSHWFDYLEELPGISFWVCCFQFHGRAFHLLLFIHSELSLYLCLQFLISVLIFAFCFFLFYDCLVVTG